MARWRAEYDVGWVDPRLLDQRQPASARVFWIVVGASRRVGIQRRLQWRWAMIIIGGCVLVLLWLWWTSDDGSDGGGY